MDYSCLNLSSKSGEKGPEMVYLNWEVKKSYKLFLVCNQSLENVEAKDMVTMLVVLTKENENVLPKISFHSCHINKIYLGEQDEFLL